MDEPDYDFWGTAWDMNDIPDTTGSDTNRGKLESLLQEHRHLLVDALLDDNALRSLQESFLSQHSAVTAGSPMMSLEAIPNVASLISGWVCFVADMVRKMKESQAEFADSGDWRDPLIGLAGGARAGDFRGRKLVHTSLYLRHTEKFLYHAAMAAGEHLEDSIPLDRIRSFQAAYVAVGQLEALREVLSLPYESMQKDILNSLDCMSEDLIDT